MRNHRDLNRGSRREEGFKGEAGRRSGLGTAGGGGKGEKREEWGVSQGNGLGTIYWDRRAWDKPKEGGVLRKMVWSALWNTAGSQAGGDTHVSTGFRDRSVTDGPEGTGLGCERLR